MGRRWSTAFLDVAIALIVVAVLAVTVGPRVLPYRCYAVLSGSMRPTIATGSLVFVRPVAAGDLEAGDVITFERPGQTGVLVTHRILAIDETPEGRVLHTKGDANAEPDAWVVPVAGSGWRYAFAIPYLGFVFSFLREAASHGLVLLLGLAAGAGVVLWYIWNRPPRPRQ